MTLPPLVTTPRYDNYHHTTLATVIGYGHSGSADISLAGALETLKKEAAKFDADAVVAVTHSTSHSYRDGRLSVIVTATGTAVRLPWPVGKADPALLTENPDNLQTR